MNNCILKDWAIVESPKTVENKYLAPELRKYYLIGHVYGHPKFSDGRRITTSRIMDYRMNTRIITTRNTNYQLENPRDDYKRFVEKNNPNWTYRYLLEWNGDD